MTENERVELVTYLLSRVIEQYQAIRDMMIDHRVRAWLSVVRFGVIVEQGCRAEHTKN